jgi:hypothetical protein
LERLDEKCIEVIGRNLISLGHEANFLHLLREELADIIQGDDVHVADVPIAADNRRVIKQQSQDEGREEKLQLLQQAVESALKL